MRDTHKGFFVVMAVMVPLSLMLLELYWPIGLAVTLFTLLISFNSTPQQWAELGMQCDTRNITIAVLIGGTLLVIANSLG